MTPTVRAFRPSDAEAACSVVRAAIPYEVTTPEVLAWQAANAPAAERSRTLVAESGGRIVGTAKAGLIHDAEELHQAYAEIGVHPASRGKGSGRALLAATEGYLAGLGATTVRIWVRDEEPSRAFAERHGYRGSRTAHHQRLDLTGPLPGLPDPLPDGVRLGSAADFAADPRPMYEADMEATADEPGDVALERMPYEDWLAGIWRHPSLDHALSTVATVGGAVAAYTAAYSDGSGRYHSAMTGTMRVFRGRGLAKLVKTDSLLRARAAGCTEAFTANDADNAPMLAVNAWFGYEPAATEVRCVRELPRH